MELSAAGPSPALACLRAVLALARRQAEALEADDLDCFERLLDERASQLAALDGLEDGDQLPDVRSSEWAALETTARRIIEQDRRNQAALGDRLNQVRTELPILAAGSRVAAAYRGPALRAATYVDRSS